MKVNNSLRYTRCAVTGKSIMFGNRRSHALNATRHAQKANLQTITMVDDEGFNHKVKVSAKGLKTLKNKEIE
jgi:large subunit ribosomal protein L28